MWFKQMTAIAAGVLLSSNVVHALDSMDDDAMRQIQGQALFNTNYIAPGAGNPNANIGFYRLGLEAELQLNANIKRLALGCDGVNGAGPCDIELSNVRLTGIGAGNGVDAGPPTSAVLTNPFFEFAIRNPTSPSTREIVGLRFGSAAALGKLSIGENPDVNNINDDTGITTITGDLTARLTNSRLTDVCVTTFGVCTIPTAATIDEHVQQFTLRRSNQITIQGASAQADFGSLTLGNVWLNNQPLDTLHQINIAEDDGSPTRDFYLSVQKQNVIWRRNSTSSFAGVVPAEEGWWLSIPRVQIPNIVSDQEIRIGTLAVIGGLFGGRVNVNAVDLQQRPVDNCFGALTFC